MATRESRKIALKEDVKHTLEELWRIEEEEPLYKIFTIESLKTRDVQKVLQFFKADLNELSHRNDDAVIFLEKHEVGDVRMMFHYRRSLIAKNLFPEDMGTCRFTSITRKDYIYFSTHPDAMVLFICSTSQL